MSKKITIKKYYGEITVGYFDEDKDLDIRVDDDFIFLSPNEVDSLITHLAIQMGKIGEPVTILNPQPND